MSRLLIAATHKSSGKTTISLGLCAALAQRGLQVQPFKKGPDYIDPLWLSQAAKKPCYNLDFYTQTTEEIQRTVAHYANMVDINLIEGNMGLYDGLDIEGSNSNAALAKLLNTSVLLVINTQGMARGIAPLLLGYQAFDPGLNIAGIILNKTQGTRHETNLRAVIEHYTDLPVLGALCRNQTLNIEERHLGLIPSNESHQSQQKIQTIADTIAEQIDLDQVLALAQQAPPLSVFSPTSLPFRASDLKIGIIHDEAFGFYYAEDLDAFREAGAALVFINALQDKQLPEIDGLMIGGGFPETHMDTLAKNTSFKQSLHTAIEEGLPVYAECGGLMYLARRLYWGKKTCDMVGSLPCDIQMEVKPQGRGYVQLQETGHGLWPLPTPLQTFPAHEFHHSKIINLSRELPYAYKILRGSGIDGQHDGFIYKNTQANYAHLRQVENNDWVKRFVAFVRKCKYSI